MFFPRTQVRLVLVWDGAALMDYCRLAQKLPSDRVGGKECVVSRLQRHRCSEVSPCGVAADKKPLVGSDAEL